MSERELSRREALARTGWWAGATLAAVGTSGFGVGSAQGAASPQPPPFRFSLNTSTLRGQKLGIVREIEVASQAGYQGIEPWVDSVQEFVKAGGKPGELRQRILDSGLTVEGAIGFPEWVVEDDARRAKGVERAKREMDLMAQIGGRRLAVPPAGATDLPKLDLLKVAERYRVLLEAGDQIGIVPELELWGFSKNLGLLGECVSVAMESGHPKACVLADVFHLHKGGSDYRGMNLLGPETLQVFHLNDFPSDPPREKIDDSHRVYPGDGVAPLADMLRALRKAGGPKVLSLELFNRTYWAQDPLEVARNGLAKMRAVAAQGV